MVIDGEYSADDETIAASEHRRTFEANPDVRRAAGRHFSHRQSVRALSGQRHAAEEFGRALVKADARSMAKRPSAGNELDDRIDSLRRLERAGRGQRVAAREIGHVDPSKVDRHATTGTRRPFALSVDLQSAYLHDPLARQNGELGVFLDRSGNQGTRHHRAEPLDGEHAIDRQSGLPRLVTRANGGTDVDQGAAQFIEAAAGPGRDDNDRGVLEEGPCRELPHFHAGQFDGVGIGQVGLRQGDDTSGNSKQPADVEVLACLRHHRFISRHHQQGNVHTSRPGEHVLDEPLVARNVNERQVDAVGLEVRKSKIDRDSPGLLFLQPIGIGSGQGADQRALAVIDVARCPDDY